MPTSASIDSNALVNSPGLVARRTASGMVLDFPVCRAWGPALGLSAFALLCGVMPALGLSALLPLQTASASALVSLALIGGFATPFILASIVFLLLAIYLLANSLHVEISADHIRAERRLFGRRVKTVTITRGDIADIEPRISARDQNVFSATPRYALVAIHRTERSRDVVVAEDLAGPALMNEVRTLISTALQLDPANTQH